MMTFPPFRSLLAASALLLGLSAPPAFAAEHGEAAAAPAPLQFVVNLGRTGMGQSMLQIAIVLKPAKPEFGQQLDAYKPKIQHTIIQLLCANTPEGLRSEDGKAELASRIQKAINGIFHATRKNGVKEVLFTQFMIAES
jgi:flagellar basal body-associated protein FliL